MTVRRCEHCDGYIEWMLTRYGRKLPFSFPPIPIADDVDNEGWIPGLWTVNHRARTVLAPVTHYGAERRSRVRHVVLVHACEQYRAHVAAVPDS